MAISISPGSNEHHGQETNDPAVNVAACMVAKTASRDYPPIITDTDETNNTSDEHLPEHVVRKHAKAYRRLE